MFCWMQLFDRGIHKFSQAIQNYYRWSEKNPNLAKVSLVDVSLMVCSPVYQCASVIKPCAKQLGACQSWWLQPAFVCTFTTSVSSCDGLCGVARAAV